MFKRYIVLLLVSCTCIAAHAQSDTLLYYLNSGNQIVDKAQADHYVVIAPPNAHALYPVYEFYLNGKRRMVATSYTASAQYLLHGTAMHYFPDGKRKAIITYKIGAPVTEINYYPNGKVYCAIDHDKGSKIYKACNDTTGTAITQDGNGKWLTYNADLTKITGGGQVIKGRPEGEWHESFGDGIKSTIIYHKGTIKSGVSVDKNGKTYQFKQALVKPQAKMLNNVANDALTIYNKNHPTRPAKLSSPLFTFFVDDKGHISDVEVINNDFPAFSELLAKAVTEAAWQPALQNGVPIGMRTSYPLTTDQDALAPQRDIRGGILAVPAGSPIPAVGTNINQLKGAIITY